MMDEFYVNEDEMEQVIEFDEDDEINEDNDEHEMVDEAEIMPYEDDSKVIFSKHSGSVFCCDVDKNGLYCATGGEDDKAYIWNIKTGDIVIECTGHSDSVVFAKFNFNSTLVATGDMSGKIKIWQLESKSKILSLEVDDLKWMLWHNNANVLFAGAADGFMWMWKIPSGECKSFFGTGRSCEAGIVLPDGLTAACGYEDGTVKFWNVKTALELNSVTGINSHKEGVICIDCDSTVTVATGSGDGTTKLISSKSGKVLKTLECNVDDNESMQDSVESVAFCSSQPLLATATVSGNLGIWDLTKQLNRFNKKQESGIMKVMWDNNQASGTTLYTAGLDGIVRLWDARTGAIEKEWKGHTDGILDMVIFNNSILTTSDDSTARVFSVLGQ